MSDDRKVISIADFQNKLYADIDTQALSQLLMANAQTIEDHPEDKQAICAAALVTMEIAIELMARSFKP